VGLSDSRAVHIFSVHHRANRANRAIFYLPATFPFGRRARICSTPRAVSCDFLTRSRGAEEARGGPHDQGWSERPAFGGASSDERARRHKHAVFGGVLVSVGSLTAWPRGARHDQPGPVLSSVRSSVRSVRSVVKVPCLRGESILFCQASHHRYRLEAASTSSDVRRTSGCDLVIHDWALLAMD
jgi:hypothetical protein